MMGQQGDSRSIETASTRVFDDFQKYSSHPRVSVQDAVVATLREHYPGYSVTVTPASTGIISFAQAGQAEAKLDTTNGIIMRSAQPAKGRAGNDTGKLLDRVFFGKYDYQWNHNNFIVYTAEYPKLFYGNEQIDCILHKLDKDDATQGRSLAVDELIIAASRYTSNPHDEVFVFDQEVWTKSNELWSSVRQSSWDDVILNSQMKESLIGDVEGFFDCENEYKEFAVPWKVSPISTF